MYILLRVHLLLILVTFKELNYKVNMINIKHIIQKNILVSTHSK